MPRLQWPGWGVWTAPPPHRDRPVFWALYLPSLPAGLLPAPPFLGLDIARRYGFRNRGEEREMAPPTMTPNNSQEEFFAFFASDLGLSGSRGPSVQGRGVWTGNTKMTVFSWKLRLPLLTSARQITSKLAIWNSRHLLITPSVARESGSRLAGWFCSGLSVSVQLWAGAAVSSEGSVGRGSAFKFTYWLLAGFSFLLALGWSSLSSGPLIDCLSILPTWQLASPKVNDLKERVNASRMRVL